VKPGIEHHRTADPDGNSYSLRSDVGTGKFTLIETADGLVVDFFHCDPAGKIYVEEVNRGRRGPAPKFAGTVLGAFEKVYDGALIRRSDDPECYTRLVGSEGDAAVHGVRLRDGVLELLTIDPGQWVNAAEYVIAIAPDV
jgi:hypothetical protein